MRFFRVSRARHPLCKVLTWECVHSCPSDRYDTWHLVLECGHLEIRHKFLGGLRARCHYCPAEVPKRRANPSLSTNNCTGGVRRGCP